jgi:hypothetical protein
VHIDLAEEGLKINTLILTKFSKSRNERMLRREIIVVV